MACACNITGLLSTSYQGIFSASINGSTIVEVADDGTILLGETINNLTLGAYAYLPGQDRYLGASCPVQASASIPWVTKRDCATDTTYFIPRSGAKASITNGDVSGIASSIIRLECTPGIISTSFDASGGSNPAAPFISADRVDGFNLIYAGNPIAVETGKPQLYTIELGFVGTITAFLQNFSLSVAPPEVAKVQYSFVFTG